MPADDFVDIGAPTRVRAAAPDLANPPTLDDAYPAIIEDQRTMLPNGTACETAIDVYNLVWLPWAEKHGLTLQEDPQVRVVTPYINQSRWVADCPECQAGMACWDRNPQAACLTCGRIYKVAWQSPTERAAAIRILAGRRAVHRNWDVHRGETVDELVLQNVLMLGDHATDRHGLLTAAGIDIPLELNTHQELLDRLRTRRQKHHLRGARR